MAGSNYFLDSNIIIDLFHGNEAVNNFINNNESISLPVIVVGELYFGAENSNNIKKHNKQVDDLITDFETVNIDFETAKYFAKIKSNLKKLGKPIPENDIWIAALTLQHNRILVTNDNHFSLVEKLKIKKI